MACRHPHRSRLSACTGTDMQIKACMLAIAHSLETFDISCRKLSASLICARMQTYTHILPLPNTHTHTHSHTHARTHTWPEIGVMLAKRRAEGGLDCRQMMASVRVFSSSLNWASKASRSSSAPCAAY